MDKAAMQEQLGIKLEIRSVFGEYDLAEIALLDTNTGTKIQSMRLTYDHICKLTELAKDFADREVGIYASDDEIANAQAELEKFGLGGFNE